MPEHIKVPAVTPVVRYVANGVQTVFSYSFPIFASEDLKVYVDGAEQVSGFTISGAGDTAGGNVTFDTAPADQAIVTLERELPIERVTDFLEGGDFSAQSINNELDYVIAALQQVNRENDVMLRYGDHEAPGSVELPAKSVRANKALGFDGDGNPVAVSLEGAMAAPDFTANGVGAVTRTSSDKLKDAISVKDFGAVGDGLTDDTNAIKNALTASDSIYIPSGSYLISSVIDLSDNQALIGQGHNSVIKCQSNSFNAIEITGRNTIIQNLRIEGGDIALKFFGKTSECTQNSVSDVQLIGPNTGIQLDGYTNASNPCYWNNFSSILIEQQATHGVHLTLSGAGDTPNANRFHKVRVFSKGVNSTGSGFYIEDGSFNNSFIDCEADMDNSGGEYDAYNAGYPYKNTLKKTTVSDLNATLMRYDTEYNDTSGTLSLDASHSVHLVSSFGGVLTVELPNAADASGAFMVVKKTDSSGNVITVTEDGGNGPDGRGFQLGAENDYVAMISNGAEWFVISSNRSSGNTRYHDGTGTYDIDMAVDTYLLSSFGGVLTARLPPANAAEAVGRTVTIKKTDSSSNTITVTEQGGSGPDGFGQPLNSQYDAITVVSNGANWFIVSKF